MTPRLLDLIPEIHKGKLGKNPSLGRIKGARGQILTPKRNRQSDILKHRGSIRIPDDKTIYVVSPGYFGHDHYHEIPEDAFVIVVNYAIRVPAFCRENDIPELKPAIWLCADRNLATAPECHWFIEELSAIIEAGYPIEVSNIKAGGPVVPVFDSGFLGGIFLSVRVTFDHGRSIKRRQPAPIPGRLRGGLTISCQAVQLAYWLGAKKIIICGIDMYGARYFDERSTNVEKRANRIWSQTTWFNRFIYWLKEREIEVVSLSRTALDVPQPEDGPEIKHAPMVLKPGLRNSRIRAKKNRRGTMIPRKPR